MCERMKFSNWSGESILETHKIEFDGIGGSQLENDVYKARLMRFNLGPDAVGIHGKQDLFVRLDASEDKELASPLPEQFTSALPDWSTYQSTMAMWSSHLSRLRACLHGALSSMVVSKSSHHKPRRRMNYFSLQPGIS